MSFIVVFIVMLINDSDILVETEDGACQEKRLRHIIEQSGSHVVDLDDLIGHERDAAHDEQHRTGILRDFEAVVFHDVRYLHHRCFTSRTEECSDHITENLKDRFNCLVHIFLTYLNCE